MSYDPNQPRNAEGEWTDAGDAIRKAASDNKKPSVTEIAQELQDAYKNSNASVFQDLLKTTSTWEKHETIVENAFKELTGSEKQIVWAKKIRDEKAELYLINKVSVIWDFNTQKNGFKGFGIKTTEEEFNANIKALNKRFDFLFTSHASTIIDNRF